MKATQPKVQAPVLATAGEVIQHVRRYYAGSSWAVFEGVADATGLKAKRWADAIAFGLWPSRGMDIHGVEVKVSRSDLARELANPHKAEAVAGYCDYWWIAVSSEDLVRPAELPSAWGLLVPCVKKGMRVAKPATRQLEPKALDRGFVAAILRRAAHVYDPQRIREQLRSEIFEQVRDEAIAAVQQDHEREIEGLRTRIEELNTSEDALRKEVYRLTKTPATTETIRRAMDLITTLQGWNGAHGKLDSFVRLLERDEHTLGAVRRSLGDVRDLLRDLIDPGTPT